MSDWKKAGPERIQPGDHVRLAGSPPCWLEVVDIRDPRLIVLALPERPGDSSRPPDGD